MVDTEFQIKPEKGVASVDTSTWPLLLKVSINFISHSTKFSVRRRTYFSSGVSSKSFMGRESQSGLGCALDKKNTINQIFAII